jgi:hypothetical protein
VAVSPKQTASLGRVARADKNIRRMVACVLHSDAKDGIEGTRATALFDLARATRPTLARYYPVATG